MHVNRDKLRFRAGFDVLYEKSLYLRENVQIRVSPNKLRFWAGFYVFYENWLYLRENVQIRVRAL